MPATKKSKPKIPQEVADKIRLREEEARNKGWSHDNLWEPCFWNTKDGRNRPGLAAVMSPDDEVGEINERFIEVIHASGKVAYFFHPDRKQSWHKGNDDNAV